jgi:hypothetical protein
LTTSFGYAARPEDARGLSAKWITASMGVGYAAFIGAGMVLDLRGEILAEHLAVTVDNTPSSHADTTGRWMAAFRAGGDVAWTPLSHAAVLLGAEAILRPAGTDVVVGDERVGSVDSIDYSLPGGVRVTLP